MIKKNDVVVDYRKRILHVEGTHKDGAENIRVGSNIQYKQAGCSTHVISKKTSFLVLTN